MDFSDCWLRHFLWNCPTPVIWMSLDSSDDQSTLVQVMAWWRQATSHYLSQCWPRSLSPYGVTRPQWVKKIVSEVNSLWPSDAIWWHRSESTFAQVMAFSCQTAPRHYLNQCWLIISKDQWHSSEGNFTRDTSTINQFNYLENYLSQISFKFPRGQWVNHGSKQPILPVMLCGAQLCDVNQMLPGAPFTNMV